MPNSELPTFANISRGFFEEGPFGPMTLEASFNIPAIDRKHRIPLSHMADTHIPFGERNYLGGNFFGFATHVIINQFFLGLFSPAFDGKHEGLCVKRFEKSAPLFYMKTQEPFEKGKRFHTATLTEVNPTRLSFEQNFRALSQLCLLCIYMARHEKKAALKKPSIHNERAFFIKQKRIVSALKGNEVSARKFAALYDFWQTKAAQLREIISVYETIYNCTNGNS